MKIKEEIAVECILRKLDKTPVSLDLTMALSLLAGLALGFPEKAGRTRSRIPDAVRIIADHISR